MNTARVLAEASLLVLAWTVPAALAGWLFVGAYLLDHRKSTANQEEL